MADKTIRKLPQLLSHRGGRLEYDDNSAAGFALPERERTLS